MMHLVILNQSFILIGHSGQLCWLLVSNLSQVIAVYTATPMSTHLRTMNVPLPTKT